MARKNATFQLVSPQSCSACPLFVYFESFIKDHILTVKPHVYRDSFCIISNINAKFPTRNQGFLVREVRHAYVRYSAHNYIPSTIKTRGCLEQPFEQIKNGLVSDRLDRTRSNSKILIIITIQIISIKFSNKFKMPFHPNT